MSSLSKRFSEILEFCLLKSLTTVSIDKKANTLTKEIMNVLNNSASHFVSLYNCDQGHNQVPIPPESKLMVAHKNWSQLLHLLRRGFARFN